MEGQEEARGQGADQHGRRRHAYKRLPSHRSTSSARPTQTKVGLWFFRPRSIRLKCPKATRTRKVGITARKEDATQHYLHYFIQ